MESYLSEKIFDNHRSMSLSTAFIVEDINIIIDAPSFEENMSSHNFNSSINSSKSFKDNIQKIKSK